MPINIRPGKKVTLKSNLFGKIILSVENQWYIKVL